MANRLTNLVLDEISLVDRPANEGARVVFFKRAADPGGTSKMPNAKILKLADTLVSALTKAGATGITKEDLAASIEDAVAPETKSAEELETERKAVEAAAEVTRKAAEVAKKKEEEVTALAKKWDAMSAEDKAKAVAGMSEMEKGKMMSDMTEEMRKVAAERDELKKKLDEQTESVKKAAALEDRLAKSEGRIAAMEQERIEKALTDELAEAGVAEPADTAKLLNSLPDTAHKAMKERLLKDAAVLKHSELFKGIGDSRAAPGGSAEAELTNLAKKAVADSGGKLAYEAAYADIYKNNIELRKRVENEERISKAGRRMQ